MLPIILFNILFLLPLFTIINIYYPIFKLLYGKSKRFSLSEIPKEHQKEIEQTLEKFATKFKVEDNQKFYKIIDELSLIENSYFYIIKDKQYCYQKIRYIFNIIELAKDSLDSLAKVNKDNKAVAYYENTKNSSIDDLLEEFQKELEAKGHKKKYLKQSINETRLKKLLVRMKKPNSRLFFNFYLTIFSFYSLEDIKVSNKDEDAFELTKDMLNFLSLGHATPSQIQKSVAIQIYYLYKDKIDRTKLLETIGELIDLCFQTKEPYTNFNNIDQEPYIKNLVDKFPIFECNNDLAFKQQTKTKKIFIYKSPYLPSFFPLFFKKYFINKIITKPLPYYQKNAFLIFFGLFSAKV